VAARRIIRTLTDDEVAGIRARADHYVANARRYLQGLAPTGAPSATGVESAGPPGASNGRPTPRRPSRCNDERSCCCSAGCRHRRRRRWLVLDRPGAVRTGRTPDASISRPLPPFRRIAGFADVLLVEGAKRSCRRRRHGEAPAVTPRSRATR
jgi:hypothetical protein